MLDQIIRPRFLLANKFAIAAINAKTELKLQHRRAAALLTLKND